MPSKYNLVAIASLSFWTILLCICFLIGHNILQNQVYEKLAWPFTFLVHFSTLFLLYRIIKYFKAKDRKIIIWFFIINFWLFIVDLLFYFATQLNNNYLLQISAVQFVLYYAPCIIYCIVMIIFLSGILLRDVLKKINFLKIAGGLVLFNIIIMFLFLESTHNVFGATSWQSISQIALLITELILFNFAILGLIFANSRSLILLLSGPIILITGDFFMTYTYISPTIPLLLYGQLLWLLGLLCIMLAILTMEKHKDYSIKDWFGKNDMIKSRLAFWVFSTSIIGFLLFFIIAYFLSIIDKTIFLGLPLFIMVYSMIAIILSISMGRSFEAPFKKLENNIRSLMIEDKKENVDGDFSTEEFRFLQKFILDAYEQKEFKDRVKKRLGEITAQVAHDIKSPTAALLVLSQTCTEIPEEDRIALREAAHTIQDIANNVLNQYRLGDNFNEFEPHKEQDLLMSTLVLEVISEKRLQYKSANIRFDYNFEKSVYFAFVKGDQTRFKRMLSNLMNNAIDACDTGNAYVSVALRILDKKLVLSICDNGKGMAPELIQRIMQAEIVSSGKEEGHGLGLLQVRETLKEYGGSLEFDSAVGLGTTVSLSFLLLNTPGWIANQMLLESDAIVAILDDDISIHTAWDHRLRPVLEEGLNIKVVHFKEGQEVIDYVAGLNHSERAKLFLLTDYELLRQSLTGLDVLEATKIERSILVTSHYANVEILERAILLGAKVLPKLLVAELAIGLKPKKQKQENFESVDLVIVDNKPAFMTVLINHYLRGKQIKMYDNPYIFLENYHHYPKDMPICLDNDFGIAELNGRMLAEKLYQEGYTRLYFISGSSFKDLPSYLTVLEKHEIGKALN